MYRQHLEMISALPEYDDEPAREPAAEPKQPQPEAARPAEPQPQEPTRKEQPRDNRETAPEKTEPDHFNEEPLIDFSSALGDEMQEDVYKRQEIDIEKITPLQAMVLLAELKARV